MSRRKNVGGDGLATREYVQGAGRRVHTDGGRGGTWAGSFSNAREHGPPETL